MAESIVISLVRTAGTKFLEQEENVGMQYFQNSTLPYFFCDSGESWGLLLACLCVYVSALSHLLSGFSPAGCARGMEFCVMDVGWLSQSQDLKSLVSWLVRCKMFENVWDTSWHMVPPRLLPGEDVMATIVFLPSHWPRDWSTAGILPLERKPWSSWLKVMSFSGLEKANINCPHKIVNKWLAECKIYTGTFPLP